MSTITTETITQPIESLYGAGPKLAKNVAKLVGGERILDLVWHLPGSVINRGLTKDPLTIEEGQIYTGVLKIGHHAPPKRKRSPYRVYCETAKEGVSIVITFFQARGDYVRDVLPEGQERLVSGRVEFYDGTLSLTHPDHITYPANIAKIARLEPVYPLTQGLSLKVMHKLMEQALHTVADVPEWIEPNHLKAYGWQGWKESLLAVHHPNIPEDVFPVAPARTRLAYDELLANQLAYALRRSVLKKDQGVEMVQNGSLLERFAKHLPFSLTDGQAEVIETISQDMASPHRMLRLLQGDVGSGKTIVAFYAALQAVEAGFQAAIMAPTAILAEQHRRNLQSLLDEAGLGLEVQITCLTGADTAAVKKEKREKVKAHQYHIVIGTHALFQESVQFHKLGLVVMDEQHRFGVKERLRLSSKGERVDLLVMTATPIPRTLSLTYYGEMEVSSLKEKPAGRKPIKTVTIGMSRLSQLVESLIGAVNLGEKAYWICPLVEESEVSDMAAAEARYKEFQKLLGDKVGLVHGRMKAEEKDAVMQRFKAGEIKLLIATTVVEVGVDVPDATIMLIEHAERFGMSQLHQLRGRVGRGDKPSSCTLLYSEPLGETGRRRLSVMRDTEDGFKIAEADLELRGSGELLGTRQSGMPQFRLAEIGVHKELLLAARDDAKLILHRDPGLSSERGRALRLLLKLFNYHETISYLDAG